MPVAYDYIERGLDYTLDHADHRKRRHQLSQDQNGSSEQDQLSMSKEDEDIRGRGRLGGVQNGVTICPQSRDELIARIKREHRPAWCQSEVGENLEQSLTDSMSVRAHATSLLPPIEIVPGMNVDLRHDGQNLEDGFTIERPRSALHAGDFRQRDTNQIPPNSPCPKNEDQSIPWTSTSPTTPWYSPQLRQSRLQTTSKLEGVRPEIPHVPLSTFRDRAFSYSAASSFIFRAPTSPLAVHSNSNDFGDDEISQRRSKSPDKSYRRRTFSPTSSQNFDSASNYQSPSWSPSVRPEGSFPYQAHQPRRSISTFVHPHSYSACSTSPSRVRRPSTSGEQSFLQHAPMVGRYEESILRGRMSTLPSKPLDFVAQIGVLGKGNCRASLKCPPHITIPFPAVFYDYTNPRDHKSSSLEGPSPYVGQVDLENHIGNVPASIKVLNRSQSPESDIGSNHDDLGNATRTTAALVARTRRRQISKRVPKGSYRIPQQGQLQIVIKTPNKTAVKLFLVQFDLTGMKSGEKTFIRQRSYSAGPIIDMPLSARTNLGTDRPEAALNTSDNPEDRPVLRYLIHLHICCPSRGRYYLYKSIRIVFANRVPDGKEKLRVETQIPEPRYSAYKPELNTNGRMGNSNLNPSTQQMRPSTSVFTRPEAPFSINSTAEPCPQIDRVLSELKPVFAFPRLPPQRSLSRISSNGTSGSGDFMSIDNRDDQVSPRSTASSQLQSPTSWTSPVQSRRNFANGLEDTSSLTGRPVREGLLALQLRDWSEHS